MAPMCHSVIFLTFKTQIFPHIKVFLSCAMMSTIYGGGTNIWNYNSITIAQSKKYINFRNCYVGSMKNNK